MGAGLVCSAATFLAGGVALLGWLYFTTSNAGSTRILRKSAALFAVPTVVFALVPWQWGNIPAAIPAMPWQLGNAAAAWLILPFGLWALTLAEEALKAWSARSEAEPFDRFWLVVLFGVWELMLAKPLLGLQDGAELAGLGRLELLGVVLLLAAPVLMHAVTAALYAFGRGNIISRLVLCWSLHVTYEASVGLGFAVALTWCVALIIALAALWPDAGTKQSSESLA